MLNMKKMSVVIVAGLILAAIPQANAYIRLNFDSASGSYLENGGTGWGYPTFSSGDAVVDALFQVIWSIDSTMGAALPGGGIMAEAGGTDVVLYSGYTSSFGQIKDEFSGGLDYIQLNNTTGESDATFYSGYLYLRVFNSAVPQMDDWYVDGSRLGVGVAWQKNGGLPENPTFSSDYGQLDMTMSPDAVADPNYGSSFNHVPMNQQVVPEPGTFALFGLGLVTILARRRMRK